MKPATTKALITSCVVLLCSLGANATTKEPPPPQVTFKTNANDVTGIFLRVHLKTSLENAWHQMNRPSFGKKVFTNVKAIKPSSDNPNLWAYHLKSPFGVKVVNCAVRRNTSNHTVSWNRKSGALKHFQGHWKVWPSKNHPGYVVAEYANYVEPGGLANLFFTKKKRKNNALSVVPRLKQLMEHPH